MSLQSLLPLPFHLLADHHRSNCDILWVRWKTVGSQAWDKNGNGAGHMIQIICNLQIAAVWCGML